MQTITNRWIALCYLTDVETSFNKVRLWFIASCCLLLLLPGLALAQGTNISFPGFRSSFISGTDMTIIATANTVTGTTVSKVEFLVSSAATAPATTTTVLGEDLTFPYTYTWSIPAGQLSYNELRTRVTYASGVTAVSSSVPIDIYEPTIASNLSYYVSASLGSTTPANNGTDPASPWSTIQAAMQLAKPGDNVYVMAGTYSTNGTNVVTVRRTGTPDHWVTLANYQNDRPKIAFNGPQGIQVLANVAYVNIRGFEIIGNNANVTLLNAYNQAGSCVNPAGTPPNQFNGNGISIDGRNGANLHSHHIVVSNNIVHDCGGAGISALQSDYITFENNTSYNNSWYTVYGTSGINVLNSWNYDSHPNTAPTVIIRNNKTYANRLYVRWKNGGTNTCKTYDGNGIILDNNNATKNGLGAYSGRFLIENNVVYQNGGRGININYSDNVTILNNTTYQNGVTNTVNSPSTGEVTDDIQSEFIAQGSLGINVYNNIFSGRPGEKTIEVNSSSIIHNNNLTFEGTGSPYFTGGQNITGKDPLFVDAANADFQLQASSPAINAGSNTPGQFTTTDILGVNRPQGAGVDIGAFESTILPPDVTIMEQPASGSAVCVGATVTASVSVSGTVQGYQWYKDGTALTGVASATTATLTLTNVTTADAGSYSVMITASTNLTSTAFSLTVSTAPSVTITANPGLTVATGTSVTLTASGANTYQWSNTASTTAITVTTANTYSVTGTIAGGCSATAQATVVFVAPPAVNMTFPEYNSSFLAGTTINIQATATTPAGTTIAKVEFYSSASFGAFSKIGEATSPPYSLMYTLPAVSAGGQSRQFRAVITNSASVSAGQSNNYNSVNVYPPDYAVTPKFYYVKAGASPGTAGTEAAPFNTIQKAADKVAPGDIVYVMAGDYTSTSSDIVSIRRTGTPAAPVLFRPYNTDKPRLVMGNNNFNAFNILPAAAYVTVQGFEVLGNNANITLAQAQAQPGACEGANPTATPTAKFNGNGISVNGRNGGHSRPHHIVIANNTVHDCGGGGIGGGECDYVTIEDNTVYNNSYYTVYGTSGINIINAWNYDNNTTTPRIIIRNNRSFGNKLLIAWNIGGTGTNCKFYDGNGIILDNNNAAKNSLGAYTGRFLIENNLSYQNGGRGININFSDNADIINNTVYQNGASDGGPGVGIESEIIAQGGNSLNIYNNIFFGRTGEKTIDINTTNTNVSHNNNLTFGGTGLPYFTGNQNITGQDPLFVDAANGNFQLQASSPAINAGSSISGQYSTSDLVGVNRPQGAGVDIGAYESTGPLVAITQQPVSSSAVCLSANVTVSVSVSGVVQGYQWYKDGPSGVPVALTGTTSATTATLSLSNVSATDAGSYLVVITAFNNLTSTAFNLTVNSPPTATFLPSSGTLTCAMPSLTLTARGGTSYVFSGGTPVGANQLVVSSSGMYSVTATDASGCSATATTTVESNTASPTNASLTSGTLTCSQTSVTLTASATGGTSYTLSDGQSNMTGQFVVSTAGNYSVVISSINGCTATTTATVTSSTSTPAATLTASSPSVCAPVAITLTAGGGGSYTFSAGAIQIGTTNQATVTQSGTYSVTVSNMSGCTATASVSATVSTAPAAPTLTNASRTVNQSNTALPLDQFVNATSGNTLSFSGVNGAIANPPTATVSQPGTQSFSVTQTSSSGCTSLPITFTITVQQNAATTPASQTVCRSSVLVLTAPTAGSRYEWYKNGQSAPFKLTEIASIQKGTTTSSLTVVSAQTTANYYVKVFQANGSFAFDGPFQVAVNYGCTAPGARQATSEEPAGTLSVQLMPNPLVNGQLRAIVTGAAGQPLTAQLTDLNGRLVHRQDWSAAEAVQPVEWDVSGKPVGVYLLHIQSDSRIRTVKVLKQD